MATERPLRLGVAGFGKVVREYYLPALRVLPGAELVAVADPLPESRAAALARVPSVATYRGHRELLDREQLDAVLVASPPSTHVAIWRQAAERDLPAFVEKPLGVAGASSWRDSPPEARSLLMINFNRRFWPTYRRVSELARSRSAGRLERVEIELEIDIRAWSSVTDHRLAAQEGGALHDLGSGALDLVWMICGEAPKRVEAKERNANFPGDGVYLRLELPGGVEVDCELGYGSRNRERLLLETTRGLVRLDSPQTSVHVRPAGRVGRPAEAVLDGLLFAYRALRRSRSMLRYSIHSALDRFLRSVRTGEPFSPGFDDALANMTWLDAAARSLAESRPVAIAPSAGA